MDRWTEYFKELLNDEKADVTHSEQIYYGPEVFISEPTITEVYDAIKKMEDNRAPGEDCITSEMIKKGGRSLWKHI